MLTLTRKEAETIRIGQDIEITVKLIKGSHVRIGVAAPRDTPIVRGELKPPALPEVADDK